MRKMMELSSEQEWVVDRLREKHASVEVRRTAGEAMHDGQLAGRICVSGGTGDLEAFEPVEVVLVDPDGTEAPGVSPMRECRRCPGIEATTGDLCEDCYTDVAHSGMREEEA